jgi:uncharacterized protein
MLNYIMTPQEIITSLQLEPLTIEGGFFRETYRAPGGTCIYYLLHEGQKSDWHKVAKDEIWLYHAGSPAIQILLFPDGHHEERLIGPPGSGGEPQSLIPAGVWQAAVLFDNSSEAWGLFGAVVIPAFEYADFTPGIGAELAQQYPAAAQRVNELGLS